jgi:hypothetical protein
VRGLDGFGPLFIDRKHLIRVAVVRGDDGNAPDVFDGGQKRAHALIHGFHRDNGCVC